MESFECELVIHWAIGEYTFSEITVKNVPSDKVLGVEKFLIDEMKKTHPLPRQNVTVKQNETKKSAPEPDTYRGTVVEEPYLKEVTVKRGTADERNENVCELYVKNDSNTLYKATLWGDRAVAANDEISVGDRIEFVGKYQVDKKGKKTDHMVNSAKIINLLKNSTDDSDEPEVEDDEIPF